MTLVRFRPERLIHPEHELVAFVQRMVAGAVPYPGPERRSEPRWRVAMPVPIVQLDEHLHPCGSSVVAISRDVSMKGMGLYHTRPIEVKSLLAAELRSPQGDTLQAVLEVIRCRAHGRAFEIGGRFVAKVHGQPPNQLPLPGDCRDLLYQAEASSP